MPTLSTTLAKSYDLCEIHITLKIYEFFMNQCPKYIVYV